MTGLRPHGGKQRPWELQLGEDRLPDLSLLPSEGPFGGDAFNFRLGIEGRRLALAYEYDPYFSLSISRVDPLPHQVEAVYAMSYLERFGIEDDLFEE